MMWKTLPRSELTRGLYGWRGGAGPAMLLIHGVGMRADFWSHLIPHLVERFSVTAIDMPGHGHSPSSLTDEPSLAEYSDAVAECLSLHDEPSFVVGHSMGALIALDLAVRHTETVAGIGVVNGVYRRSPTALSAIRNRVGVMSDTDRPDSISTLLRWFGESPCGVDLQARDACQRWLDIADRAGYLDGYRAFSQGDAPADRDLQGIRLPALFMTGALEPNSTPAMSMAMSAKVPDSHCIIVENARHMLPMTHGNQLLAALNKRFSTAGSTNE